MRDVGVSIIYPLSEHAVMGFVAVLAHLPRILGVAIQRFEGGIDAFVDHYNHQRYHESLNNVTPADAYFGRAPAIIKQRIAAHAAIAALMDEIPQRSRLSRFA